MPCAKEFKPWELPGAGLWEFPLQEPGFDPC